MTTTVTLTGHDRHRILDDLWAVTGLGEHIHWVALDGRRDMETHYYLDQDAHVAPLAIAYGLLDDPHVWGDAKNVYVRGYYRGVAVSFAFDEKLEDQEAAEAALADLNAAIGGERDAS